MGVFDIIPNSWRRFFGTVAPGTVGVGAAGSTPAPSEYSLHAALATASRFPWVWVCTRARAGDLAGLPLRAIRADGAKEQVLDGHPALDMLRSPSPGITGLRFRRQVYFDWNLGGNAMWRRPPGTNLLYRLHPYLTVPQVDDLGRLAAWKYGENQRLKVEEVHHVADVSWTIGPSMLLGETPIRALHDDLTTILRAMEMAQKQAGRGRLEMLFSPSTPEVVFEQSAIDKMEQGYERFTRKGLGAFFVGEGLKGQPINVTPRDLEFSQMRTELRDQTMAVFEVPPARAGVNNANYGTAKEQMRTYWASLLKGQGALFDDEFSELTGSYNTRVEHDATGIEALQSGYTERYLRAERLVNLGATPKAAMAYEGFPDAPVGDSMEGRMRPPSQKVGEPQEKRGSKLTPFVHEYLAGAAERYEVRILSADGNLDAVGNRSLEAIHALRCLERAGVPAEAALQWADDIAHVADEAARLMASEAWERGVVRTGLHNVAAFSPERAESVANDVEMDIARSAA